METKIEISYMIRKENGKIGETFRLQPEEYYDMDVLDKGEEIQIDSIPLYDTALEYLEDHIKNFDYENLIATRIFIQKEFKTLIITGKYWNKGDNMLFERMELFPDNFSHTIVIGTLMENKYRETIRLFKEQGMDSFKLVSHIIDDNDTDELFYSYPEI